MAQEWTVNKMDVRKIDILADTIQGELNRMCVTDDIAELDSMALHAKKNIDRLQKMAYENIKDRQIVAELMGVK